jgi:hypothetical protein
MDGELHWNDEIPGKWSLLYFLDELVYGRVLRGNESGVYRLVGLARPRVKVPRVVPRVCDKDVTGTLYIGRGNGRRIQGFAHSLKHWIEEKPRFGGHHVGVRLRTNAVLSSCFPPERLAITWSSDPDGWGAERKLLLTYVRSFGELPPLNGQSAL